MWTSIISNTNRSSQCNCSPIAVLHTEDVVRLPKTCFSLVETRSSLVISKPLIFYQYWMQEWDMFLSWISVRITLRLEKTCYVFANKLFLWIYCLCSCSFFCLNTYIMWCDHAVELVLQLLAWESTSLSDAFILHGPYLFIWANPFEKACCGIRGVGKIEDLKGNLPWICLGAQLQLILSSKTFPKSPTEYVKPHFSHVFLIVIA